MTPEVLLVDTFLASSSTIIHVQSLLRCVFNLPNHTLRAGHIQKTGACTRLGPILSKRPNVQNVKKSDFFLSEGHGGANFDDNPDPPRGTRWSAKSISPTTIDSGRRSRFRRPPISVKKCTEQPSGVDERGCLLRIVSNVELIKSITC